MDQFINKKVINDFINTANKMAVPYQIAFAIGVFMIVYHLMPAIIFVGILIGAIYIIKTTAEFKSIVNMCYVKIDRISKPGIFQETYEVYTNVGVFYFSRDQLNLYQKLKPFVGKDKVKIFYASDKSINVLIDVLDPKYDFVENIK
jgi:hypothetical protein